MKKKILLAGWNDLSPNKKKLVSEWVESVLHAQAASKALIELCNCDDVTDDSTMILDAEVEKENFEIVGSENNSEEVMPLVELPDVFTSISEKFICLLNCERIRNTEQKRQCQNKC